ncbi:hypothetical protein JCM19239_7114 [Vibrio variabilis]|uniref:Uncharacterized protein n=1 Tax=Vibrio variabilis TaxID=990271 RepID=A0ABQ0JKV8_9VIBR|nr:hypothetical protein JCM19239_7114 [Vibrio variabilis]
MLFEHTAKVITIIKSAAMCDFSYRIVLIDTLLSPIES